VAPFPGLLHEFAHVFFEFAEEEEEFGALRGVEVAFGDMGRFAAHFKGFFFDGHYRAHAFFDGFVACLIADQVFEFPHLFVSVLPQFLHLIAEFGNPADEDHGLLIIQSKVPGQAGQHDLFEEFTRGGFRAGFAHAQAGHTVSGAWFLGDACARPDEHADQGQQ
jgi:hypothetical protein